MNAADLSLEQSIIVHQCNNNNNNNNRLVSSSLWYSLLQETKHKAQPNNRRPTHERSKTGTPTAYATQDSVGVKLIVWHSYALELLSSTVRNQARRYRQARAGRTSESGPRGVCTEERVMGWPGAWEEVLTLLSAAAESEEDAERREDDVQQRSGSGKNWWRRGTLEISPILLAPAVLPVCAFRETFFLLNSCTAITGKQSPFLKEGSACMGSTSSVHSVPCTLIAYGYSLCPLPWPHFHVQ
jgi:hypothetical protein